MGTELTGDALARANEMDEFTEKMTPELIGKCEHTERQSSPPWCRFHDKYWPPQMEVCVYARDMEAFADQLLEAWENRNNTNTTAGERHE